MNSIRTPECGLGGTEKSILSRRNDAYEDDNSRYQSIRRSIENKSVLDFGCGFGGFLKLAKNTKEKYGIELEEIPRKFIEAEGIKCFESIVDAEKHLNEEVDVITLFHVLEHLEDPIDMLTRLRKLKKENGRIVIEVPNADDALLGLYGSDAFADFTYWSCHLFLFTNETIKKVAEKAGLKTVYR